MLRIQKKRRLPKFPFRQPPYLFEIEGFAPLPHGRFTFSLVLNKFQFILTVNQGIEKKQNLQGKSTFLSVTCEM